MHVCKVGPRKYADTDRSVFQDLPALTMQEPSSKVKKKKKTKHSTGAGTSKQSEDAAVAPDATLLQRHSEIAPMLEPSVHLMLEEPVGTDARPKHRKKKHGHINDDTNAAAGDGAAAAAHPVPILAEAELAAEPERGLPDSKQPSGGDLVSGVADLKPKQKKRKHKDGLGGHAATAVATSTPHAGDAGAQEHQPAAPAAEAAAAKPQKHKHKDGTGKSKQHKSPVSSQPVGNMPAPNAGASPQSHDPAPAAAAAATVSGDDQPALKPKRTRKARASSAAAEAGGETPAVGFTAKKVRAARVDKPSSAGLPSSWRADASRTDVKRGKFSKQEKETLKDAAIKFGQERGFPTDTFEWLLNGNNGENKKEVAGVWQSIAQSLPHRNYKSIYACGTRMLSDRNYQVSLVWSCETHALRCL